MKIHVTHGIHTSPKSRRFADLCPVIEEASGTKTVYHEYGDIWALQTRWKNPGIAERLGELVEPGDVLWGHSNGAAVWIRALMMGAPARGLVLLNPALDDRIRFPSQLEFIHVYYNDDDGAVPWASYSPHWLTDPLWGDMGRDGYKGLDWRVRNFDCEHTKGMPSLRGHSAIITEPDALPWVRSAAIRVKIALLDQGESFRRIRQ